MKNLFLIFGMIIAFAISSVCGLGVSAFSGSDAAGIATAIMLFAASFIPAPSGALMVTFTQGLCEKIQTSLIEIMKSKAPQLNRTKVGYLDALMSPQNRAGVEIIPLDQKNGKKRQVLIKYLQRGLESDIITEFPEGCTTNLEKEPLDETVEIENYIGTKGMKFTEDEMRKLCEADAVYINNVIRAEIDPLIVSLDKALITLQGANFGKFNPDITPATYKEVSLIYGTREEPHYIGEKRVLEQFENMNLSVRPMLIGAGKLDDYAIQQKIGCCNDYGVNLQMAGNFDYFNDRFVGSVLGDADYFIGLAPGFVQLLTWNKYVGEYMKENDVFSHTTLVDPFTGLKFDMKVHYDDCNEYFYIQFGLWYTLWFLPTDAYAYGDELYQTNGTLKFKAIATSEA